nr:MAG TPA: hypothetical protein [Caudoviricetes sp.]
MLNVFELSTSINEAMNTRIDESLPAYDFIGSLEEASFTLDYKVMQEALDAKQYSVGSDEIMIESAIGTNDNFEVLTEAAKESFIKKIWNAVLSAVKWVGALIKKIIDWITGFMGRTKSYQKKMKEAIDKIAKSGKIPESKTERYRYDVSKLSSMVSSLGALKDKKVKILDDASDDVEKIADKCQMIDDFKNKVSNASNAIIGDINNIGENFDNYIESYRKEIESEDKQFISELSSALGISSGDATTIKAVMDEYLKAVRGEKKEYTMAELGGAQKVYDELVDATSKDGAMNKLLAELKKYQKQLDAISNKLKRVSNSKVVSGGFSEDIGTAIKDAEVKVSAVKALTKATTLYNAIYATYNNVLRNMSLAVNTAQGIIRTVAAEKVSADVASLNAYVRAAKAGSEKKSEKKESK